MKSKKVKALGLSSGGLDSILAALVLKEQGIDVTWISFVTPFFSADNAKKASESTGIPLIIEDITDDYLIMLHNPKAGYGKNMNPCMDCHTMMFNKAGEYILRKEYDFLFSGEVSGQRPFSQRKQALRYVEKHSGFDGSILRPLSAKNLPITKVEESGLVDREQLLNITGRGRKIQIALAKKYGIKDYPSPAGGCLLTDIGYSKRLRDLFENTEYTKRDLNLLRYGRQFRVNGTKIILGRSKEENENIESYYSKKDDILIRLETFPGPGTLITEEISKETLVIAGEICVAYAKIKAEEEIPITIISPSGKETFTVKNRPVSDFAEFLIGNL
ncbi:MAG: tRNA 4-thiouridine(8) synthase ThiI [Desulfobacterales bacterium]|nr:tRNA 4-thiouridine(8) synthase ThiI [Desulfobacterales bacterium]MCP4162076.1 tRNA 4-thiouridine(8) synthase ThiI [Deltaproteobacteria bacterium]